MYGCHSLKYMNIYICTLCALFDDFHKSLFRDNIQCHFYGGNHELIIALKGAVQGSVVSTSLCSLFWMNF